jgi:hypothetical protein
LERQGMIVKANSACASKLPPNPKKGINTVFNHFRDKPARDCQLTDDVTLRVTFWQFLQLIHFLDCDIQGIRTSIAECKKFLPLDD